ncbi:RNA polymerase sigma-70 factor (ECF subfamily) [Amycolatopsis lexingtonensis]|uniref:RNA polymerase sigma-70 factor (ECF subfamily) n=1 Tax=Amycolatopsis lexingtonensis TaxID=218822 RepID=A0ABR9I4V0_9PSEU|nr:sigma-70 family RNA polymerase sigma factor [Amycolatopsis lexingtonensis]MBE1498204.1 RNA polymerase sigma-70 factor (ECF subfamily) [Amycolatopsis lexingtonensis]
MSPLPPDIELVAALRGGDEGTFAAVLAAWSAPMLRVARSFVSTHASAEEVVQETWLAVVKSLDAFEGRSAVKTWVYRILVNTAKKRGAAERRSVPWASLAPDGEDHGPTAASPETTALAGEIRRVIAQALDELPARQRAVIGLRDVADHTAEEVCELLEITAANQRVLLHRARAVVRARLADYLGAEAKPA